MELKTGNMAELQQQAQLPLLLPNVTNKLVSTSFASMAKWVLKLCMWVLFISWIAIFFLVPCDYGAQLYDSWVAATSATLFGKTGSALLLYNGPIFLIAFLSIPYLAISRAELRQPCRSKTPSFSLWAFPVLVNGPLGIVSAAELLGILVFVLFVFWAAYSYTVTNLELLADLRDLTTQEKWVQLLQMSAYCFGLIALSCLAFLFLPVARGSILLSLIDIPFEHATRYHIWLGHLTMCLLTLHGLGYMLVWTIRGVLLSSIIEWKSDSGANFAGVISYAFGLFIWMTAFPPLRKQFFEVFYYSHQLYILFIIFFALHVGDTVFGKAAGGVFLFMLDRFLRFCQSQHVVNIISATSFPCGTMKFLMAKSENLQYNALSFIFLRFREISWLQWHPFSVSSSPLDSKYHLSVHIKPVGGWTSRLTDKVIELQIQNASQSCSTITAFVEGPYGHEVPYHMMYENLVLVAGGSGISPFLAILSDILHHVKEGKPCVPQRVLIIWTVKKSNDLSLLSTLDISKPLCSDELYVEIKAFVTQESDLSTEADAVLQHVMMSSFFSPSKRCNMSVMVGTGKKMWAGTWLASSIGFIIVFGLLDTYYINPFNITHWWYKGLLLLVCIVVSIFVFGGLAIGLWYCWEKLSTIEENIEDVENIDLMQDDEPLAELHGGALSDLSNIRYGCRPDFREIFGSISDYWGDTTICVIVCGPPSLQSSVAKECRSRNLHRRRNQPMFHFNNHSFDF